MIKCSASLTFYPFSPTCLINSIKRKHSCKSFYISILNGKSNNINDLQLNVYDFLFNDLPVQSYDIHQDKMNMNLKLFQEYHHSQTV